MMSLINENWRNLLVEVWQIYEWEGGLIRKFGAREHANC